MTIATGFALAISAVLPAIASAQNADDGADAHIATAKAAAGDDFQNLFQFQCYDLVRAASEPAHGVERAVGSAWAGRGGPDRRNDPPGISNP